MGGLSRVHASCPFPSWLPSHVVILGLVFELSGEIEPPLATQSMVAGGGGLVYISRCHSVLVSRFKTFLSHLDIVIFELHMKY